MSPARASHPAADVHAGDGRTGADARGERSGPAVAEAIALPGGTANRGRVFRVGDAVHRPRGTHTPAVHALLRHLEDTGFDGAPRVLGVDGTTERLRYIDGVTARDPLPAWATGLPLLRSVGALLARFRRHAAGFDARRQDWQREVPARWRGTVLAHNDPNPANVVIRGQQAVALIDFDLAAPAHPAWDLALAACFWVPLRPAPGPEVVPEAERGPRLRALLDGAGASAELREDVVAALVDASRYIAGIIEENARLGHPAFGALWERSMQSYLSGTEWIAANRAALRVAAQGGRS